MDLSVDQGRTKRFRFGPVLNANGTVIDWANKTLVMAFKTNAAADDETGIWLLKKLVVDGTGTPTTETGITLGSVDLTTDPITNFGPTSGYFTVKFTDEETESRAAATYPWEMVLMNNSGDVYTETSGNLTIIDTLIDNPEVL